MEGETPGSVGVVEGFRFGSVVFGLPVGLGVGFAGLDVGSGVGELFGVEVGVGVVDGSDDGRRGCRWVRSGYR